jgi:hypothetical protein
MEIVFGVVCVSEDIYDDFKALELYLIKVLKIRKVSGSLRTIRNLWPYEKSHETVPLSRLNVKLIL